MNNLDINNQLDEVTKNLILTMEKEIESKDKEIESKNREIDNLKKN